MRMLRFLSMIVIAATFVVATTLYQLKYDARVHLANVQRLERLIDEERGKIAVLKAEYSLLTSPSYLEKKAQAGGMVPLTARQIITEKSLRKLSLGPPITPVFDKTVLQRRGR